MERLNKSLLTAEDLEKIEKCENLTNADLEDVEVVDVAFTYGEHRQTKTNV